MISDNKENLENEKLVENISGIWNVPYVCELGIQYHCNEVKLLNDNYLEAKGNGDDVTLLTKSIHEEMVDLYLILKKYIEISEMENLIKERITVFSSHNDSDKKYLSMAVNK